MTTECIIRIALAIVLGAMVGMQREYHAKDAGIRTHFLVALGSALFMVVSQFGFSEPLALLDGGDIRLDPSRMAAQVVSGIGFIGAGTIIFQKNVVRGLTTAAGLWVTAAIGVVCGAGMYVLAAVSTILVIVCLETVNRLTPFLGASRVSLVFSTGSKGTLNAAMEQLKAVSSNVQSFEMADKGDRQGNRFEVKVELRMKRNHHNMKLLETLHKFDDITVLSLE